MNRLPAWAVATVVAASVLATPAATFAQDAPSTGRAPSSPSGAVTRILAVGTLTASATPSVVAPVLQQEVPATLKLYLGGRIDAWYAKTDQTGVVFILDVRTVEEARALLEPLPLGRAGMMTFELIPLGPLRPLGILLHQPAK